MMSLDDSFLRSGYSILNHKSNFSVVFVVTLHHVADVPRVPTEKQKK